jgi:hypothetical protein
MHLADIARYHTYLEPPWPSADGFHPFAQGLQRHQFEFSDAIAFPIDQGPKSAALDPEFGAGVVVVRFAKSSKSFKPVH